MDPALGIIEAGDLLIDDGKIVAVGRNVGSWAVREIDGRGMIAMPGFINGHIHLWQTALRGIAADWTLDHYFGVLIGKVVNLYTPQDAYIGNLVGALDQINSGVTTLFDWCHIVEHAGPRRCGSGCASGRGHSGDICVRYPDDFVWHDGASSGRRQEDAQGTAIF